MKKLAVVLFNLGGPDSLDAVKPFLFNLFSDKAIIGLPWPLRLLLARVISARREDEAKANYAHMGGASPLLPETEKQAEAIRAALESRLPGVEVRTFTAMRYWRPFTVDAARAVAGWGPDEIVLLPLYPQFSTTTTGSSLGEWRRTYQGGGRVRALCCYPLAQGLIESHARHIEEAWKAAGSPRGARLLFSAHGLPEKVIKSGDPYQAQIEATAEAVAGRLIETTGESWDWEVCYQSRVGPLRWIGPSTPEALEIAGAQGVGVVVTPIAFVSEHVETLVELDRDYGPLATDMGCPFYIRVPALGCASEFIGALAGAVVRSLGERAGVSPASPFVCAEAWGKCPLRQQERAA
ncbi:MAG: ferrochelatase [Caulobacteraceae bacterium]